MVETNISALPWHDSLPVIRSCCSWLPAPTALTEQPTDAGALVDAETCSRLTLAGCRDPRFASLQRADSGTALAAAGDLVHTGPTGTNVGDLVIGLKLSAEAARVCGDGSC